MARGTDGDYARQLAALILAVLGKGDDVMLMRRCELALRQTFGGKRLYVRGTDRAWVSEIKVRAERRAGELIREAQEAGKLLKNGQRKLSKPSTASLSDSAITRDDSSKALGDVRIP